MSSQLYREFRVYTFPAPTETERQCQSLLGGDQVVAVFDYSTANNDDAPHKWDLCFIGMEADFIDYFIPGLGYYFDDGLARNDGCGAASFAGFKRLMGKLFRSAEVLSVGHFKALQLYCYSWSEFQAAKLPNCTGKPFTKYGDLRFAHTLNEDNDLKRFVAESLVIQSHNADGSVASATDRLWDGRPWFHRTSELVLLTAAYSGAA